MKDKSVSAPQPIVPIWTKNQTTQAWQQVLSIRCELSAQDDPNPLAKKVVDALRDACYALSVLEESKKQPTIKETMRQVREIGMTCGYKSGYQEFRVNFPGGREETAHYTNDPDDAIATAKDMKRRGNF